MKFLPYENITYKTKLDRDEIRKRIRANLEPVKRYRTFGYSKRKPKDYEGSTSGSTFDIAQIIKYKNAFLPQIKGEIESNLNGAEVKVKMRLNSLVLVFMCFVCGILGLVSSVAVTNSLTGKKDLEPEMLVPLGMILVMYGVAMIGFKSESIKTKKDLAKLFEAEIEG